MLTRRGLLLGTATLGGCSLPKAIADDRTADAGGKVQLTPNRKLGGYDFETDEMQGTIRPEGDFHGVARLVHKRTKRQVIDPRYSALNLFKLMAVNQCMGQPRTMERKTRLGDGFVELTWQATPGHRAQLVARYEVVPPNAVHLTVSVTAQGTYPGYELFLSSYFDRVLRPFIYLKPARFSEKPELVLPTVNDVFRGMLPVFPRDVHAARRCIDGRWDRVETNAPTVPQCPARRYGHCLGFAADRAPNFAVLLMAHPRDCYAISTRYHADKDADRLAPYTAFDFSLFGDDLLPGRGRTVKVRLALTDLDREMSQPLKAYQAFLAETEKEVRRIRP
jgi:hypothetical protein